MSNAIELEDRMKKMITPFLRSRHLRVHLRANKLKMDRFDKTIAFTGAGTDLHGSPCKHKRIVREGFLPLATISQELEICRPERARERQEFQ